MPTTIPSAFGCEISCKNLDQGECRSRRADRPPTSAPCSTAPARVHFKSVDLKRPSWSAMSWLAQAACSALDADERGLLSTLNGASASCIAGQSVVQQAPVQQVVLKDDDAISPRAGKSAAWRRRRALYFGRHRLRAVSRHRLTNVGCRRIMLRGRRQAGVDLIAPSDMRAIISRRRPQRAGAGRLCGGLASGDFWRDGFAAAGRRTDVVAPCAAAGAGGEMRHQ